MMQLNHCIFDEASISMIATDTVREICRLAGRSADVRRFRPNILVRPTHAVAVLLDANVFGEIFGGLNSNRGGSERAFSRIAALPIRTPEERV